MRRLLPFLALAALLAGCGSTAKNTSSTGGSVPAGASVVRAGRAGASSRPTAISARASGSSSTSSRRSSRAATRRWRSSSSSSRSRASTTSRTSSPRSGPSSTSPSSSAGAQPSPKVVALTKPDDPAKFKALVAKLNAKDSSGQRAVYREVDGWYALSDSQAAITQALEGNGPLADDPAFKEAMGKLAGDALVKAYVDGPRLNAYVSRAAAQNSSGFDSSSLGLDKLKYVAASASAEDNGVRIQGASSGGPAGAGDFASELIGGVPGDAFAFLDFNGQGTTDQLEKLKSNPQAAAAIAQLQQKLGVTLDQLVSLLSGEVAFYARQGVGIPELTLALAPQGPDRRARHARQARDPPGRHVGEERSSPARRAATRSRRSTSASSSSTTAASTASC